MFEKAFIGLGLAAIYLSPETANVRPQIAALGTLIMVVYHAYQIYENRNEKSLLADSVLATAQNLGTLAVRAAKGNFTGQSRELSPQVSVAYTDFQYGTSVAHTGIYVAS